VNAWVRGGIIVRRSLHIESGVPILRQRFVGSDIRVIVTHDASLRSVVEVRAGRLWLVTARDQLLVPTRFLLAVPPRSVLAMRFDQASVYAEGTGAVGSLDRHVVPTVEQMASATSLALDPDLGVAPVVAAARARLHDLIGTLAPVRTIATELGLRPETLTRRFAAAYGIEPKHYCHRARLFDAAIRLFAGATIADAALEAGFNDLKRFYVQFRRLLDATPGQYAAIRKRQDDRRAGR
jgi:AraC-like DNA-binding protein